MTVIDNFIPNAARVRREGLSATFIDWPGPDGEVYKRISICDIPEVREAIERAMGRPVELLGMAYRLNYGGEIPNAAIHSDMGWGTHALVLYLSEGEGGTAFWTHKATGAHRIDPGDTALYEQIKGDWDNASAWTMRGLVRTSFNRATIYESALFHSRWPFAAYGGGPQDGRLVLVAFFN